MIKGMNEPVTLTEMNQGKSRGVCHHGKGAFATKENCLICSSMIFLLFTLK
jgi:c(7)-type cytochrome triheme protein